MLRLLSKPTDDSLPFDLGLLEIDEQAYGPAGGTQIVETLGGVFVGKTFCTFQLHYQRVLDKEIRKIFSDRVTLVYCGNEASAVTRMPRRPSSRSKARW